MALNLRGIVRACVGAAQAYSVRNAYPATRPRLAARCGSCSEMRTRMESLMWSRIGSWSGIEND